KCSGRRSTRDRCPRRPRCWPRRCPPPSPSRWDGRCSRTTAIGLRTTSKSPDRPPAIVVSDVSVRYRVPKERIPTFKEYTIKWLRGHLVYHDLLALSHVSLDIARGESIGIIGRNGAGKTTLLKVIARVLRPTEGRVTISGDLAPLLELGAGFDPELSGRENV